MKKLLKVLGILILVLLFIYFLGPKASIPQLTPDLPLITDNLSEINTNILEENKNELIREGNHSRIIWVDSIAKKTEYAVIYLHGFSASPVENEELYTNFSKRYTTNLYAPRLFEHGLRTENPLLNFTAEGYINSAKKALAIGKKIGDKVILLCTSTGATAGLYLAAHHPEIAGLIFVSPNVDVYDTNSNLITKPWGKQILRTVMGGDFQVWYPPNDADKYWYGKYRIEAIIELKAMIETTMKKETFKKINQPLFIGYYYKNEKEQDKTVSVKRMLDMFEQTSTPTNKKIKVAFPEAKNHSIASRFFYKDYLKVQDAIFDFADTVLELKPITENE
ncbi:hypothetical protein OD91_2407 [Lutibacter sp. Hel_I_33_5]|uniref:alpha/beta hydrolase n=1 Tax=Lutibacter sp. Hel_I_33_5 TaxID=1566289 RepID=UPI0011A0B80D|nr:alpha/beta hydrolase [Lutibacter sp. Hel_I_33_5]TVZ57101.1 hypothetical protein OD91_2407 [Lutibacter sp. Hel_I_33_5]